MTREEMMKRLAEITVVATPTVITMDMGLEYDYMTSEGAGTLLGTIGAWPAYKFHAIGVDQWELIRNKIEQHTLADEDFAGTDIEDIIQNLHNIYGEDYSEYYEDATETFQTLMDLPETLTDAIYCLFDIRAWGERPAFFATLQELEEAFRDCYCDEITEWDEMDDEELEEWYERLDEDLSGLTMMDYTMIANETCKD